MRKIVSTFAVETAGNSLATPLSTTCAHRSLPAPEGPAPVFCCQGCAGVYEFLHQVDGGDFYRRREAAGAEPPAEPAPDSRRRYQTPTDLLLRMPM